MLSIKLSVKSILFTLLSFSLTNSFCQISYNGYSDSLNIKELKQKFKKRLEDYKKLGYDARYLDGTNLDIQYWENDSISGNKTYIESIKENHQTTYHKLVIKPDDPIITEIYYDTNGKVSLVGNTYCEYYLKDSPRSIKYPTGKSYLYDKNGKNINSINYDSLYKFTIIDVFNYLKRNKMTSFKSIEQIGRAPDLVWEIFYYSKRYGFCQVLINARTGNTIRNIKNIQSGQE